MSQTSRSSRRLTSHAAITFRSRRLKKLRPVIPNMLFGTSGYSRMPRSSTSPHTPLNQSFHVTTKTPKTTSHSAVSRIMPNDRLSSCEAQPLLETQCTRLASRNSVPCGKWWKDQQESDPKGPVWLRRHRHVKPVE